MGMEGDYRPAGEGITRQGNIIEVDVLYFPNGILFEQGSEDIAEWCLPWIQKLIGDTPLNEILIEINHKFESNAITGDVGDRYNISIFERLHWITDQLNIKPSQLTFINGNFKLWKHYDHWREIKEFNTESINLKCMFQMMRFYSEYTYNGHEPDPDDTLDHWQKLSHCEIDPDRPIEKVYNCLNRVPRKSRMSLYKRLNENKLLDYGYVSFNERKVEGVAGELLSDEQYDALPLYLDFNPNENYSNVNEWILTKINRHQYEPTDNKDNKHINHFDEFINNSFITVVPETEYGIPEALEYLDDGNTDNSTYLSYHNGFITEKTFRHIRDGHPMLWVSAPYTTDMLHYLGFETFSPIIDESYDHELDPIKRLDMVTAELKRLCELTHQERVVMYKQLIRILQYNQQHLLTMKQVPILSKEDWEIYSKDWKFLNTHQ